MGMARMILRMLSRRPQIAGQDDARHRFRCSARQWLVQAASTMSSRSPGVMSSTPGLKNSIALCAPIAPTTTSSTRSCNVRRRVQQFGVQFLADQFHRSGLERMLFVRHDAEQFQSLALEAAPGELGDRNPLLSPSTLLRMTPMISTPSFSNNAWFSADFINRFADAALRDDDDFGAENFCDLRVGQIKHRADAGVAASLRTAQNPFPTPRGRRPSGFF